jgi:peptide/nickel transport system substrate-binding protein
VIFRLDGPHAPFVSDLIIGIVPRSAAGLPRGALSSHPNGSGPFKFVSWDTEDLLVLARNDRYQGTRPLSDRLVFKTLRDDNTRLLSLLTGDGDIFQNAVPPLIAGALREERQVTVDSAPSALYTYIGFNMEDPVLGNPKVRQAVAYAIDRDALIRHKFQGLARASTGLLAPEHWAYEGDVARYRYDPARAKALLDEAGYVDPDGDGPLKRFSITYKTSTNKFRLGVARAIAAYLEDAGIGVTVSAREFGTFFEDIKSGNFQIYSLQWTEPVEPDLYRWIFHSMSIPGAGGNGSGANRGRYRNAVLDGLLEQGRVVGDPAGRKAIYSRVQKILADDLPYISLWHEDNVVVYRKGVRGFKMNPQAGFEGLTTTGKR